MGHFLLKWLKYPLKPWIKIHIIRLNNQFVWLSWQKNLGVLIVKCLLLWVMPISLKGEFYIRVYVTVDLDPIDLASQR